MLDFVRLAVGALALFLLPGYALLTIAGPQIELDEMERLCMALGLSLAAFPLFLYATTLLGLRQGPEMVWGLLALCFVVVAWDWYARHRNHPSRQPLPATSSSTMAPSTSAPVEFGIDKRWIYAALVVVMAFTLLSRLWSVRGIEYPSWTDSYGHAVITQMVLDQGTVPTTYEPYAPIPDFTYHFGFHALAAWYHWLTGVPMLQGLVILGQLLNALVAPTTFLFAERFFRSHIAGLAATVIAALISHMPALFVNWGRFTQLDGQMLLPIAAVLYLALTQVTKPRYRLLLLTTVAFCGLFLDHYRIFIFGVLLAVILWTWAMIKPGEGQSRRRLLLDTSLLTLLGLLVLAPWLWRLAQGFGLNVATRMVSGYEPKDNGAYYDFDPKALLDFGMYAYLWVAAALGALWGLWRRNRMVIVILLWIIVVFAGANLQYVNVTPLYANTIWIIALYLPLSALCGYLILQVVRITMSLANHRRWAFSPGVRWGIGAAFLIILLLIGSYAVVNNGRLFEPDNIFIREGDLRAMQWIEQQIPADALFYIATEYWTPEVAHGLDGGYYLPLLAARQTIMPPQHYASDGSAAYQAFVNERLIDLGSAQDADTLWQRLNHYGITDIYIGVRKTQLDPSSFAARPDLFVPLYHQDAVWIFQVKPRVQ